MKVGKPQLRGFFTKTLFHRGIRINERYLKMTKTQLLVPRKTRNVSAKQYLNEAKKASVNNNIQSVTFLPPVIGSSGYGSFQITYKTPQLCPLR